MAVMACRDLEIQVEKADEDSPSRLCGELMTGVTALPGSVVGIQSEGREMYTGTLIRDLIATVERAGLRAEQQRLADERELQAIFAMQIPFIEDSEILTGAA